MPFDNTTNVSPVAIVIRDVIQLLNDPNNWIKDRMRTTINGHTRYCAVGAMQAIPIKHANALMICSEALLCMDRAAKQYGFHGIVHCNDEPSTSHTDLMKVLNAALSLAEKGVY